MFTLRRHKAQSAFYILSFAQKHALFCAGTVQYGVPALILEAVRRINSSWYHNGGMLCSLCGWFVKTCTETML